MTKLESTARTRITRNGKGIRGGSRPKFLFSTAQHVVLSRRTRILSRLSLRFYFAVSETRVLIRRRFTGVIDLGGLSRWYPCLAFPTRCKDTTLVSNEEAPSSAKSVKLSPRERWRRKFSAAAVSPPRLLHPVSLEPGKENVKK